MKTPTMRTAKVLSIACLAGALLVGCDKKEAPHEDESAADAGKSKATKAETDEPDLAQAMNAVAAERGPAANAAPGGPPPNGIFAPGQADKAAAKGGPATFALGSEGTEPRVLLGPGPKPGTKRSGTVELATQSDPQQPGVPIQFNVTMEAQKPKLEADAGAPQAVVLTKVTGARINAPGVPADLSAAVGKLKGSSVQYQVGADGVAANVHSEVAKGVDAGFRDPVQALSDLLVGLALPFPSKPVGVGAFWMVTTRDVVMGLDVVSYRLVKVEKVEGTTVTLSLNTKRYAASPSFELEGLPPDAPKSMAEFRAQSEGKLTVAVGEGFPRDCELQSLIAAALGPADSKQRAMVQVQSRASLTLAP